MNTNLIEKTLLWEANSTPLHPVPKLQWIKSTDCFKSIGASVYNSTNWFYVLGRVWSRYLILIFYGNEVYYPSHR